MVTTALPCQSRADVSMTVTMALPYLCGRIGYGRYGFSVPKLCGRIGDDSYGCVAPTLCGSEKTGQEAEAKIGGILAQRRQGSSS